MQQFGADLSETVTHSQSNFARKKKKKKKKVKKQNSFQQFSSDQGLAFEAQSLKSRIEEERGPLNFTPQKDPVEELGHLPEAVNFHGAAPESSVAADEEFNFEGLQMRPDLE